MPDARVQSAIDNWAPRMVTQGVDYNDFVRTTARICHHGFGMPVLYSEVVPAARVFEAETMVALPTTDPVLRMFHRTP